MVDAWTHLLRGDTAGTAGNSGRLYPDIPSRGKGVAFRVDEVACVAWMSRLDSRLEVSIAGSTPAEATYE